jgi:hypothetical protein
VDEIRDTKVINLIKVENLQKDFQPFFIIYNEQNKLNEVKCNTPSKVFKRHLDKVSSNCGKTSLKIKAKLKSSSMLFCPKFTEI